MIIGEKEQAAHEFFAQAAERGNISVMKELVSKHGANINASVPKISVLTNTTRLHQYLQLCMVHLLWR